MNNQVPVSNNQVPVSNNQVPVSNNQVPVSNNQVPVSNNQESLADNNLPLRKRSNKLPNITPDNESTIQKYTDEVSGYGAEYDNLEDGIKVVIGNINGINRSLTQEISKISNTKENINDINYIKTYLSSSFDIIKNYINGFNDNIKTLQSQDAIIDNNIEKIQKTKGDIENFITTRPFTSGTVKSRSIDSYKGVIEAKLTENLNDLDNLLETYDKIKDKCISLISKGTVGFNKKVIDFKTKLKLNVITYFNQKILGLQYENYTTLNKKFTNSQNNTVKLNTLVEMKELIVKIKEEIGEFRPILQKSYKYNANNNYSILNNPNINSVNEKISKNVNDIEAKLNDSIQNYKEVTQRKINDLQSEVKRILESVLQPIQTYNGTAGEELSIEFNNKSLNNISTSIQTRIKNILDLIDTKLGLNSSQNLAIAVLDNGNLPQNLVANSVPVPNVKKNQLAIGTKVTIPPPAGDFGGKLREGTVEGYYNSNKGYTRVKLNNSGIIERIRNENVKKAPNSSLVNNESAVRNSANNVAIGNSANSVAVRNPANNVAVRNPANNVAVRNPANNVAVRNPANSVAVGNSVNNVAQNMASSLNPNNNTHNVGISNVPLVNNVSGVRNASLVNNPINNDASISSRLNKDVGNRVTGKNITTGRNITGTINSINNTYYILSNLKDLSGNPLEGPGKITKASANWGENSHVKQNAPNLLNHNNSADIEVGDEIRWQKYSHGKKDNKLINGKVTDIQRNGENTIYKVVTIKNGVVQPKNKSNLKKSTHNRIIITKKHS